MVGVLFSHKLNNPNRTPKEPKRYITHRNIVMHQIHRLIQKVDGAIFSTAKKILTQNDEPTKNNTEKQSDGYVELIHSQRIPANAKDILLADVDGDGLIEMVLGLTDRVVRSYRWQRSETSQGRYKIRSNAT